MCTPKLSFVVELIVGVAQGTDWGILWGDNVSSVPHLTCQHNSSTINKLIIVVKGQIFLALAEVPTEKSTE